MTRTKRPLLSLLTLSTLQTTHSHSTKRTLTSESSITAAINEYNTRADANIKIKHKCPNLNYILTPIHNADADSNGVLNQDEYVDFTDQVSGGYLTDNSRDSFLTMPLALQETYVVLSCLCELYQSEPWGGKGCCTVSAEGSIDHIGIRTNGTAPGSELTKEESDYYNYVCGTMVEALDGLGVEMVGGVPSESPVGVTVSPTSKRPSNRPSPRPSLRPTPSPTEEPTPSPTPEPTPEPTEDPTDEPTPAPTLFPTEKPTSSPTTKPTPPPTPRPTVKEPAVTETETPTPVPITTFPTLTPTFILQTKAPVVEITDGSVVTPPTADPADKTPSPVVEITDGSVVTPPTVGTKEPSTTMEPTWVADPETKQPGPVDGSKAPSVVDDETKAPSLDEEGTKAPSFDEEETKAPSYDAEVTKAPSVDDVVTKAPTSEEGTKAPTSEAIDPSQTNPPTLSPPPITSPSSKAPTAPFTGDVSIPVSFSLPSGQFTDEQLDAILNGDGDSEFDEEVKESLMMLVQEVLEEEFGDSMGNSGGGDAKEDAKRSDGSGEESSTSDNDGTNSSTTDSNGADDSIGSGGQERLLNNQANVTIDSVEEVDCPEGTDPSETCLDYSAIINLSGLNETGLDEATFTEKFLSTFNAKLEAGWLDENFNVEEALQPSTESPVASPSTDKSTDTDASTDDRKGLTTPVSIGSVEIPLGAVIGIAVGGLLLIYLCIGLVYSARKRKRNNEDDEFDLERQAGAVDLADKDQLNPAPLNSEDVSDSWSLDDASEAHTEGNSSQDHLLPATQKRSTADSTLGHVDEEEEWTDSDVNTSAYDSSTLSSAGENPTAGSSLAAVGTASTFVAANAVSGSSEALNESQATTGTETAEDSSEDIESRGVLGAESSDNGGMSPGAAAALGAAGVVTAGALAAGAYAATHDKSEDEAEPQSREVDTASSNNLSELDSAIEAGNWGAVGAIAAILASSGYPPKREPRSANSIKSEDSSARSGSRDSSTGPTLDQARATEIDKLVEAGDWQGVVLAAARFEADQTMDGESFSASASKSSYRSGSAQSSATPRSMATSGQSSTNISSARSQAEIKAEIEALVRRVVPEEADNVDEMLTQFKGREEELVETLRRMQERAIASRARLAVQKSAKLEARARATIPAPIQSSASVSSRASTKSELEAAIDAGNWEAVGQAAQKMNDGSIASLSMEDRARLKEKASASPGLALSPGSSQDENTLDSLIERGDWPGVIAAAKKASEGTRISPSSNMTQEEQDALEQANMWQEIANQSKQEGRQGPAGADDAAAWAISRSLSALNAPQDQGMPVRTIEDMADEESSEASQYESSSYSASVSQSLSADYYKRGI